MQLDYRVAAVERQKLGTNFATGLCEAIGCSLHGRPSLSRGLNETEIVAQSIALLGECDGNLLIKNEAVYVISNFCSVGHEEQYKTRHVTYLQEDSADMQEHAHWLGAQ